MMSRIRDLIRAVAKDLAEYDFGVNFEVRTPVMVLDKPSDFKNLTVTLMQTDTQIDPVSRSDTAYMVGVDVVVQKQLREARDETVEQLCGLVEDIADMIRLTAYPEIDNALFAECDIAPLYSPAHLREHSVFTGRVTAKYRIITHAE